MPDHPEPRPPIATEQESCSDAVAHTLSSGNGNGNGRYLIEIAQLLIERRPAVPVPFGNRKSLFLLAVCLSFPPLRLISKHRGNESEAGPDDRAWPTALSGNTSEAPEANGSQAVEKLSGWVIWFGVQRSKLIDIHRQADEARRE